MGRRYIGPVIDFRVPDVVKELVDDWADKEGRPADELCREIFIDGVESRVSNLVWADVPDFNRIRKVLGVALRDEPVVDDEGFLASECAGTGERHVLTRPGNCLRCSE